VVVGDSVVRVAFPDDLQPGRYRLVGFLPPAVLKSVLGREAVARRVYSDLRIEAGPARNEGERLYRAYRGAYLASTKGFG